MACICGHSEEDHKDGVGICFATLYADDLDGDDGCDCAGYEENEDEDNAV